MGTKLVDIRSIEQIIREMSLEEKAKLVIGASPFGTVEMKEYGIPAVTMLDGATGFNSLQYGGEVCFKKVAAAKEAAGEPIDPETLGGMGGLGIGLGALQKMAAEKAASGEKSASQEVGCYPPGMCLGASWNTDVPRVCGDSLAKEMKSKGVDIVLGPNVNIIRDPLAGRAFEGYSEDPCLVAAMAPEFVKGIQENGVAACAKHFAANSQETDRMGINEHIPERALQEIYFPGFKACVDAGTKTVMAAYNKINGEACAQNEWLLTEILRKDWKFDGFVVSDWAAAYQQVRALAAGNDMIMPGPRGTKCIVQAVLDGKLEEEKLDNAIRNFLKVVLTLPVMNGKRPEFSMEEAVKATEFAAKESITLLQNDGTLPLDKEHAKVSFWGKRSKAFSGSGAGSAGVDTTLLTNPYEEMQLLLGADKVLWERSASDTNAWIVTVGANGQEGADRPNMEMDADDKEALEKAITEAEKANGKVILVLNTAAPVSLMEYKDRVNAVIMAYYPGMQGGKVLTDILCGIVNPSGKLPLTYPKYYRDCPSYKNFPGENKEVWYGEGIYVGYRYYDAKEIEPLYAFGHGLSYTTFSFTDLQIEKEVDLEKKNMVVNVTVKNTGNQDGAEVVQLYIHDTVARYDRPVKELKAFKKVYLKAGEEKTVTLQLKKQDFASYCVEQQKWITEPGEFHILVGNASDSIFLSEAVSVKCENPFPLSANTGIGEIVANIQAVEIINNTLKIDIVKTANVAIVFAPDKPWKEIFYSMILPGIIKSGRSQKEAEQIYQNILEQFQKL